MEDDRRSEDDSNIFEKFEYENDVTISVPLRNLLVFTGFDNALSLSKMDDNDIAEVEQIAREQIPSLIDKNDLDKYLGNFKHNPEKFCIFPGQRKILQELSKFYSKKRTLAAASTAHAEKRIKFDDENGRDEKREKELILKSLRNWVTNFCYRNLPQEHIVHVTRELDKLEVKFAPEDIRKCAITCCICMKSQKIFMNNSGFWIMSNFHKHFKTHVAEFNSPSKKFHKNLTISNYIVKQENIDAAGTEEVLL